MAPVSLMIILILKWLKLFVPSTRLIQLVFILTRWIHSLLASFIKHIVKAFLTTVSRFCTLTIQNWVITILDKLVSLNLILVSRNFVIIALFLMFNPYLLIKNFTANLSFFFLSNSQKIYSATRCFCIYLNVIINSVLLKLHSFHRFVFAWIRITSMLIYNLVMGYLMRWRTFKNFNYVLI